MKEREESLSPKKASETRESSVELLKLIAIFFIVICHSFDGLGYLHPEIIGSDGIFNDLTIATMNPILIVEVILSAFGQLGNLIFLICSSWFLSRSSKVKPQKILKMIADVWFISVIWLIFCLVGRIDVGWKNVIRSFFPNIFTNNWFIPCYLILYAVHPFLNFIIEKANKKQAVIFSVTSLIMYFCVAYIYNAFFSNDLITFFIVYLIVGFLRKFGSRFCANKRLNVALLLFGTIGFIGIVILTEFLGTKIEILATMGKHWNKNNSIFLFSIALAMFNLFNRVHFKSKIINYFSSLSLYIYVIHNNLLFTRLIQPHIYVWLYERMNWNYVLLIIFGLAVVLFVTSSLIAALFKETISRCTTRASNGIVKKFEMKFLRKD